MIIHEGYENLQIDNPVVTTGIFDGVHNGHKALLGSLRKRAEELDGESVVVIFSPHPRLVLEKNHRNLSFLTTRDEKIQLLGAAGIDHLIIIEFNRQLANMGACTFLSDILVGRIGAKHLVIGYDHHFGRGGEGDFSIIEGCSESLGLDVEQINGFCTEDGVVSSSAIRKALTEGRIEEANSWLGYNYTLTGTVIKGKQLGRTIAFPTANLKPDDHYKLIPCNGVYAAEVRVNKIIHHGMLSIGSNPTVNDDRLKRHIEVNILNFDSDIYGEKITLIFRKRLRDEMKFENIARLAEQINIDRQQVLIFFS